MYVESVRHPTIKTYPNQHLRSKLKLPKLPIGGTKMEASALVAAIVIGEGLVRSESASLATSKHLLITGCAQVRSRRSATAGGRVFKLGGSQRAEIQISLGTGGSEGKLISKKSVYFSRILRRDKSSRIPTAQVSVLTRSI